MATEHSALEVRITPTIERDYNRRGVFPELRLLKATRFVNATSIFDVPLEVAEELLKDAEHQRADRTLPRGTPRAFTSLIDQLEPGIKRAKGLWDDPGYEEAKARSQTSPAQFQVGQKGIRYWSEWNDDEDDGKPIEIVEGYGYLVCSSNEGEYVRRDGARVKYLWGYLVRFAGGSPFVVPAYNLRGTDNTIGHLKLVYSKPGGKPAEWTSLRAL